MSVHTYMYVCVCVCVYSFIYRLSFCVACVVPLSGIREFRSVLGRVARPGRRDGGQAPPGDSGKGDG